MLSLTFWKHLTVLKCPKKSYLLGPFHIQDQVIVAKARDPCNGPCSILSAVETDESKTLNGGNKHHEKLMQEGRKFGL